MVPPEYIIGPDAMGGLSNTRTVSRTEAAALAEIVPETVGLLALAASTFWAVTR